MSARRVAITCAAALLFGAALAGERVELISPAASDLAAPRLAEPSAEARAQALAGISREAVTYTRAMRTPLDAPVAPSAVSRSYDLVVAGAELRKGIVLQTSAPGALIHLMPADDGTSPIDPSSLELVAPDGTVYERGAGMERLVGAERLAQVETFPAGSSAFRLARSIDVGAIELIAADVDERATYAITVLEKQSPWALTLALDRDAFLHGQRLELDAALGKLPFELDAVVVTPAGRRIPIERAMTLDADEATSPGLWEIHASATATVGDLQIRRDLRLAFDAAMPLARFDRGVEIDRDGGGLALRLDVAVAAAGRYEARGVLYGTVEGTRVPLALAHAAAWMEPGRGVLTLDYDATLLEGAEGPFELRRLQLLDQGRLAVLHRQEHALTID